MLRLNEFHLYTLPNILVPPDAPLVQEALLEDDSDEESLPLLEEDSDLESLPDFVEKGVFLLDEDLGSGFLLNTFVQLSKFYGMMAVENQLISKLPNKTLVITFICAALEEVLRTPSILISETITKSIIFYNNFDIRWIPSFIGISIMHYIFDNHNIALNLRILFHFIWNYMHFCVIYGKPIHFCFWLICLMLMYDIETNPGPVFRVTGCKHRHDPHVFQLNTIHDVIPAIRTIMLCHDQRMPEMRLRADIPHGWVISLQAAMIGQIRRACHHITLVTDFPIRDICRYYDDIIFRRSFNEHVSQIQDVFDAFDHPASDNIAEMLGFSPKSPILGNVIRKALEPKSSDFDSKEKCVSQSSEESSFDCGNCSSCMDCFDNDVSLISLLTHEDMKNPALLIKHHFAGAHRCRLILRDILLSTFKITPQGDFDLLGTKALAASITDTAKILDSLTREIIVPEMSKARETIGVAASTLSNGVDVSFSMGFMDYIKNPATSLVAFSVCYIAIELLDDGKDAFKLIKYLIGVSALYYYKDYLTPLVVRWFTPSPQGDEGMTWIPLLLEGIQLATTGFSVKLSSIDSLCKSLRDIGSTVKASEDFATRIMDWFKKALLFVSEKLGYDFSDWFHSNDTKLKSLQRQALLLFQEQMENPMSLGLNYCERVATLSMQVNDMISATPNTHNNSGITIALTRLQDKLYVLQRSLSDLGLTIGERDEPAFICKAGAPGTGKTYDADFHAQFLASMLADSLDLIEMERSWKSKIYTWPLDGKHHDQYMGQPITCFPDLFCQTDAKGQPSEAVYLIYLVGGQPLNLLAAEITKKQKLWFLSKVIMACTNVVYIPRNMFESMHNPDALIRRINEFGFYQYVNPKYILRDATGKPVVDKYTNRISGYEDCDELYARLDTKKLVGHDPNVRDIYFFRRLDFSTGSFVDGNVYTTDQYYQMSLDYVRSKLSAGAARRQEMADNAKRLIELRRAELTIGAQASVIEAVRDNSFEERMKKFNEIKKKKIQKIKNKEKRLKEEDDGYETCQEQGSEDFANVDECWAVWSDRTSFNSRLCVAKDFVFLRQEFVNENDYEEIKSKFDLWVLNGSPPTEVREETLIQNRLSLFLQDGSSVYIDKLRYFYSWLLEHPKYNKVFSEIHIRYIVEMLSSSFSRANQWYYYYYYKSNVYNPITCMALYLKDVVVDGLNSFKSIISAPIEYLRLFPMFKKFWYYLTEYMPLATAIGITTTLLVSFTKYIYSGKKKKNPNAEAQHDWNTDNQKYIYARQENFLSFYVTHKSATGDVIQHPCNAMMLGGRYGVIADHVYMSLQAKRKAAPEREYVCVFVPFGQGDPDKSPIRFKIEEIEFFEDDLSHRDLRVFKLPGGRQYPRLESCIPPLECLQYLSDKVGLRGRFMHQEVVDFKNVNSPNLVPVRFRMNPNVIYYDVSSMVPDELGHINEKVIGNKEVSCWMFEGEHGSFRTVSGECISPGFITDERKNYCVNMGWKQAQQPWLVYSHIALGSYPNGVPLHREMFQKYFDMMRSNNTNRFELLEQTLEEYSEVVSKEMGISQQNLLELRIDQVPLDDTHYSTFVADSPLQMVAHSTIKRSPCYGIDERTRVPSRLRNFYIGDTYIDVMKQAREPYGSNTVLPSYTLIRAISHDVATHIYNISSPTEKREVLTLDQALYGDNAYSMSAMNWNGSPGFILRLVKAAYRFSGKGLRWMMDGDRLTPRFYNIISKLVDINKKRLVTSRMCNVYIDNLKDELLNREKVKLGKTRLYCSSDRIYLILCKMYYGAFAGWINDNKVRNGIAIGVNPYSRDWDDIYHHLKRISDRMIFGDYSKFDKKQLRVLMETCLILMDMFYNDKDSEAYKIRHNLFEDIVDSIHVVVEDGKLRFYVWDHGNTSGNFLTAILNSIVNIAIIFICACIAQMIYYGKNLDSLSYDFMEIADNISFITLGDDVVISVGNKLEYLTFKSMKVICFVFLGIEFTDELKSDGDVPDYRDISEGSFLGRKFRVGTYKSVIKIWAYLRRYSIVECVQWIKGVFDPNIEILKFEALNLEMSQGPSEDFYSVVLHYADACYKKYGRYPRYTDYEVARDKVVSLSCSKYSFDAFLCDNDEEGDFEQLNQFLNLINFDL